MFSGQRWTCSRTVFLLTAYYSSRSANLTSRGGAQQAFGLEPPRSSPTSCRRRRCSGSKRAGGTWRQSFDLAVGCPSSGEQGGDGTERAPASSGGGTVPIMRGQGLRRAQACGPVHTVTLLDCCGREVAAGNTGRHCYNTVLGMLRSSS